MVFKTLSNFSRYSSTTKSNASHSFFDPSYIGQQKVTVLDGILGSSSRHSSTAHPQHSIAPSSSSFIVFDPSFLQNNTNNQNKNKEGRGHEQRILLKKASHKVNKNGHVNVSIDNITDQFTTLTLRRSNATHTKTITINRNEFIRANLKSTLKSSAKVAKDLDLDLQMDRALVLDLALDQSLDLAKPQITEEDDFLKFNLNLIGTLHSQGKNNEILAVYNRIKEKQVKPSLPIYNLVLESIPARKNVKESLEENLTLLMDVYSDMLANGIKPNQKTFEKTILPLLNGCIKSFLLKDIQQASQYFKIANELFKVGASKNLKFDQDVYEKVLVCNNLAKFNNENLEKFSQLIVENLGYQNILYYLGIINLCKHSKNHKLALEVYSQFKAMQDPRLLLHSLQVYSSLIRVLISCNQMEVAAKILDQCILNIRSESGMQKDIQPLISSFVVGLADVGLVQEAFDTVVKFDAIPWLPKLSVNSLMILVDKLCEFNQLELALKFWDFAVVRKDFDSNIIHSDNNLVTLLTNLSSVETKYTYSRLVQLGFYFGDKTSLIRLSKEMLLKGSLKLELPLLRDLVKFLVDNGLSGLAVKIVCNQGFKLNPEQRINHYLSSVIDLIPQHRYKDLMASSLYRNLIENYSLIDDNIYSIYQTFNYMWSQSDHAFDNDFKTKLAYYYKTLFEELDDLNNYYVEMPDEIKRFKATLETYLH